MVDPIAVRRDASDFGALEPVVPDVLVIVRDPGLVVRIVDVEGDVKQVHWSLNCPAAVGNARRDLHNL